MKKTRLVRIDNDLKKELELKLPKQDWPNRLRTVYGTSLVKQQERIDLLGKTFYGKSIWNKLFKK